MTDCLMYWKYYWSDVEENPNLRNIGWHTGSQYFFGQVKPGDSLWVVVSGGAEYPEEWRLLQRLVIKSLEEDGPVDAPFHAIGNPETTEHYDVQTQPDFSSILHQLEFASGRRITLDGSLIGRAIQAIRPLADKDIALLEEYSRNLKRQP